ncbi:sigma-70 family RNA polymerase sigma factor [Kutzneria sp. CA-103260]|uniref:sigma-70 family RNA polymerase sigma factor n=1 Tax=Kutzneria sp. CA-103260 TaxID=2802641 RepID=UPI002011161A|nr:sigma-70 family RNA polymerase sigma factor [Kutzneria sp. CA-103260]
MDTEPRAERRSADAELVAAVAAGDQQAFAALYDRYSRQAYSLALRVCVDPEFAEEAVQEAFLAVWKDPGRFDPDRGGFASWLLTLVHHRSVDVVRRQASHRKRNLLGGDEVIDRASPAAAGADEQALTGVVGGLVRQALRQLSVDQRQVIALAYLGGYTQAEVASMTGLPLGTVKSRTFAGIKRLRDLLASLARGHHNGGHYNDGGMEVQ